jgi:D12 class N6 adenine-specific DNA methyltransferase
VNLSIPEATPKSLYPPLKWAGGKRWLVPTIFELWDKCGRPRLVEPLCGGLAIVLGLRPSRAILSDINPHNINFYKWLKRGLRISLLMENRAERYYAHRERFNHLIESNQTESAEAAALFYYLNRTGYNGLCRFNSTGRFNVPSENIGASYIEKISPPIDAHLPGGLSAVAILKRSSSSTVTSCTPILPTMSNSHGTPSRTFVGTSRCGSRAG